MEIMVLLMTYQCNKNMSTAAIDFTFLQKYATEKGKWMKYMNN